jgi:hypothetical protein
MPAAPIVFSTIICWPRISLIRAARIRPMTSNAPRSKRHYHGNWPRWIGLRTRREWPCRRTSEQPDELAAFHCPLPLVLRPKDSTALLRCGISIRPITGWGHQLPLGAGVGASVMPLILLQNYFGGSQRAILIQDQPLMRNVDSKICPFRF